MAPPPLMLNALPPSAESAPPRSPSASTAVAASDYPVGRNRDALVCVIGAGMSEIQRYLIARVRP